MLLHVDIYPTPVSQIMWPVMTLAETERERERRGRGEKYLSDHSIVFH